LKKIIAQASIAKASKRSEGALRADPQPPAAAGGRPAAAKLLGRQQAPGVEARAVKISAADTVAVWDPAWDPATGPRRRWWQQRLGALPQRIGQESIHQGAHDRSIPRPA
jgi:hypothetical protein